MRRFLSPRIGPAALKILPDVLLVLVALLLPEPSHFVLQLDDGPLDLVVLTDQRHPAVGRGWGGGQEVGIASEAEHTCQKVTRANVLGLQLAQLGPSRQLFVLPLPVYVLNLLPSGPAPPRERPPLNTQKRYNKICVVILNCTSISGVPSEPSRS